MASKEENIMEMLAGIEYELAAINGRLSNSEDAIESISSKIESATYKSWDRLISKKDLKIICKTDPAVIAELQSLSMSASEMPDAIHTFRDTFVSQQKKIFSKMDNIENKIDSLIRDAKRPLPDEISFVSDNSSSQAEGSKSKLSLFSIMLTITALLAGFAIGVFFKSL